MVFGFAYSISLSDKKLKSTISYEQGIFNKNSPLHDGGVVIIDDKIYAASCIFPISDNYSLPQDYGLRHRAGIGLSEQTDALVVIVSEETGNISLAEGGKIKTLDTKALLKILEEKLLREKT